MNHPSNHRGHLGFVLTSRTGLRYLIANHQQEPILGCMDFMTLLVEGDQRNRRIARREAKLAEHYRHLRRYSTIFGQRYSLHPYLKLFLEAYREHPIAQLHDVPWGVRTEDGETVKEVMYDFIAHVHAIAKESNLKKAAADWRSKSSHRAKRLVTFARKLAERSTRATVIELELAYQASLIEDEEVAQILAAENHRHLVDSETYWHGKVLSQSTPCKSGLLSDRVPFEQIHADRKRFFANLKGRPTLFSNLWGYVWRTCYTPVAGYSLQLSLIFDVSDLSTDSGQSCLASRKSSSAHQTFESERAQEVGEYWCEVITRGKGWFKVCSPWPALTTAQKIATLGEGPRARPKQLWQQLVSHLSGPMLAVQSLPYAGCNLFGTSMDRLQPHPQAARPS